MEKLTIFDNDSYKNYSELHFLMYTNQEKYMNDEINKIDTLKDVKKYVVDSGLNDDEIINHIDNRIECANFYKNWGIYHDFNNSNIINPTSGVEILKYNKGYEITTVNLKDVNVSNYIFLNYLCSKKKEDDKNYAVFKIPTECFDSEKIFGVYGTQVIMNKFIDDLDKQLHYFDCYQNSWNKYYFINIDECKNSYKTLILKIGEWADRAYLGH